MDNYIKEHPLCIIINIKKVLSSIITIFIFFSVFLKNLPLPMHLFITMTLSISVALVLIPRALTWYSKKFTLTANSIEIHEGIISSNNTTIPYNKIHTVNFSTNILMKFFKLTEIKVDTGENLNSKKTEFSAILDIQTAKNIKETILKPKKSIEKPQSEKFKAFTRNITIKEIIILSLTSNILFTGIIFFLAIINNIYEWLDSFPAYLEYMDITKLIENYSTKGINILDLLLKIFILFVLYIIVSSTISIAYNFLKYFNFTFKKENYNISISYGLLENKVFTIPFEKIRAVYVKKPFLRNIFKYNSINVESIGYGNEKGESSTIYPLLHISEIDKFLESNLPEFTYSNEFIKPPLRSLIRFILYYIRIPLVLSIFLTIFIPYGFALFFTLPVFIIAGYLEYKNTGIYKTGSNIIILKGFLGKTISIVPISAIQSVCTQMNIFQKRKNLFNFIIYYHGNEFNKNIKIKNMDTGILNEYLNII
ncbi:MAG: PH domain-containing protein [Clostridiales bacterium]